MAFALGDLLSILDRSLFNPLLTLPALILLPVLTSHTLALAPYTSIIPRFADPLLHRISQLLFFGLVLRANRYLSAQARNNGVTAKFDWNKEITVVTGASGGIGAQAAQMLAAKGGEVVVLDVMPLTYEPPKNIHYYKVDLTNYDALQSVAEKIRTDIGEPTCVVANAGICRGKPIFSATPRDIELTFSVNNLGLLWTAKTFLPAMARRNHGHFLIIASQTAHLATAGVVDYAATKAAALAIYEGLQTEMKHFYKAPAVRISALSPSAVRTEMFKGIKAPSNFVLPSLGPKEVGKLICDILWSGEAQNVMCPAGAYISPPTRTLPDWMRIGMQDKGADVMTELTPHKVME